MHSRLIPLVGSVVLSVGAMTVAPSFGETKSVIPHHQDRPPGPPLSPDAAVQKMTVPEGFQVELVASEPDVVNPVAMTFDERGRIWITESIEYPRHSAGKGRDRVKVLEDTNGDGKADKVTVFADGLNIPSGIAVGYGGVWVANSPDILFLRDTDGDDRADETKVIVRGFGRRDTHELPNSLTWGPDGWLYGLNGVFNPSHVKHQGREHQFTCAMFRIHPRTHEFELFAEGTSNPWGIAWDPLGNAFVSACVIDHLWHLAETGYYHRQAGAYPAHTWKMGSIVRHHHQKAAYCGLTYFDSDAYPEAYRDRLYMGNIHGGCINVDRLERNGSTYVGLGEPDFLVANDAWFMPVAQETGPDGCLYVLDWYDRYHCYQDAGRDPKGIERDRGRLYRVRYGQSPRAPRFDLAKETDDALVERLKSPNVFFRQTAQRILQERATDSTRKKLEQLVGNPQTHHKARMHGLFALIGAGPLDPKFHGQLLDHSDADIRAWGVRAAGNARGGVPNLIEKIAQLARDPAAEVRLQVAIAARKIDGLAADRVLFDVLAHPSDDPIIPHVVWQNLMPLWDEQGAQVVQRIAELDVARSPGLVRMLPHLVERLISESESTTNLTLLASLFNQLANGPRENHEHAKRLLADLARGLQSRSLSPSHRKALRTTLSQSVSKILSQPKNPMFFNAAILMATLGDPAGAKISRDGLQSADWPDARRIAALEALIISDPPTVVDTIGELLSADQTSSLALRTSVITSVGRLDSERVADLVLASYGQMEPELQPKVIELLTSRVSWSRKLLEHVRDDRIPATALNLNQVRKLLATGDAELAKSVRESWGIVREKRDPQRQQVADEMRKFLRENRGDPHRGVAVFDKVCGQCHKIYGRGQEVGPDITSNGRASFAQLLSNVFDPNQVIGAAYEARTVTTADGRVFTGLLVEDSPLQIALVTQGGKKEVVARDNLEEMTTSQVSVMPEGLEKQLPPNELADLFAFLTLDRHPDDPESRAIPGSSPPAPK